MSPNRPPIKVSPPKAAIVVIEAAKTGIPMRVAINQHYVNDDARLAHGDEVALIPPVQGG